MTKKVTGKDLEKLIEGVLNEKGTISVPYKLEKDYDRMQTTMKDLTGYKGKETPKPRNLFDKLVDLAQRKGEQRKVERADVEDYLNQNLNPKTLLADLAAEIKPDNRKEALSNLQKAFQDVENDLLNDEKLKALFTSKDRAEVDRGLRAMTSSNVDLKTRAQDSFAKIAKEVEVDVKELYKTLSTGTIDAIKPSQQPFGRSADPSSLPKTSLDTTGEKFNAGVPVKADLNLVNQFRSIGGESIIEKLKELKDFGENVALGKDGIAEWLKTHNEFDLINYSAVLAMLADISREYRAIESGYQFERWLALFMNMPVVGGENGMADNLAKSTGGANIYTSAKMYQNACGVSQSYKNFGEQFKDKNDPVYYFVIEKRGQKFGPASSYTSVSDLTCYLVKISKDETVSPIPYVGQLIGSDGSPKTIQYPLKMKDKNQTLLMPCEGYDDDKDLQEFSFFSIPTLPTMLEVSEEDIQTTAEFLSDKIEESTAEVSKKIISAYKSLQKVEQDTDNYRSVKGKGKTIGDSTSYIEAISKNYNDYKRMMNDVFRSEKEGTRITESKKITASHLQKIIEENFKK